MKKLFFLLPFLITFSAFGQVSDLYVEKGCVACHGQNAEGNRTLKAPSLAGQSRLYLKNQLINFQNKTRGEHKDDVLGKTMWGMASALTVEEMDAIAKSLSETKVTPQKATLSGYSEKGKVFYATCVACHAEDGKGNDQLNAPNLTVLPDWYVVEQLKKFKAAIRGGNPELNPIASQMMPMAMTVPTEEDMEDLAIYILSLQ